MEVPPIPSRYKSKKSSLTQRGTHCLGQKYFSMLANQYFLLVLCVDQFEKEILFKNSKNKMLTHSLSTIVIAEKLF